MPKRFDLALGQNVAGDAVKFPFSSASIDALVHATEDEKKVLAALENLLPEGVEVRKTKLRGHYGNPIIALHASIGQKKLVRELWQHILSKLRTGDLDKLRKTAAKRIDPACRLYLRFNKQLAYAGEFALEDGSDVIHLKLKVAAYPAKQKIASKLVEEFIAGASHEDS
ncbi:MAG: RNA-binding domain-containing protein [Candidatus Hadarchaeales archaeon]